MAAFSDIIKEIGLEGMSNAAGVLGRPAEEFGNDSNVEAMWAIKATEQADVHFNLLCALDPKQLRLTPHDDVLNEEFRKEFPQLEVSKLNEDQLKSAEAKEIWRRFCMKFENVVSDYHFATLFRLDSAGEYTQENTCIVPRVQFLALEITRNREGCNDQIREKFKPIKRGNQK